jgi:hypothetical protein
VQCFYRLRKDVGYKKPAKNYLKTGIFFDLIEGLQIHFKGMVGKERYRIILSIAW